MSVNIAEPFRIECLPSLNTSSNLDSKFPTSAWPKLGMEPSEALDVEAQGPTMRTPVLAVAVLSSLLVSESLAGSLKWTLYEDEQFGCVLDYPSGLFRQEAPAPDEPQRFSSPDADVYFRIQGVENTSGWSPQAIREKYLSADMPGDVTYDRTKSDFVVLSGYRGESIFYTKVAVSKDRQSACIFEITYPREQKTAFDKIVTRMSRSLRSLN